MAKLILKSPYIKSPYIKSTGGASGYLKYIATRERVEIIPDDRPPTRKQEQLITKLVKDFPEVKELYEYGDYMDKPTKANASAFITLALESNRDSVMQSERYMKYIATRPRAERLGEHGLFGDSDGIDLDAAMNELENYAGNVWTHIISLKRKDAARLGFDNAAAWRDLLRAHRNDIAAAMKIPSNDFRWYAAFHDEGEHPHVHMMAWSAKPGQAYLSRDGIRQIKSTLTNHIFQNEMLHLYEQKSVSRDELVRDARKAMLEMVRSMKEGICNHPDAERLMLGKLYLMDQGVEYDKTMGIHWLTKSAVQGNAYVTDEMRKIAAAKIDRGIAKSESLQDIDTAPRKPAPSTFLPHKGQRRKPGTGCVSQINENLWEGRYSPKLPNDDRLARNIYAHSEKECEQKLAELIVQMKAEIAAQRQQPQAPA